MWDVAVCGAGPAGAASALLLARAGLSVALIDQATFPRPKPCGEAMGPGVAAFLERSGLGLPPGRIDLEGIRLSAGAVSAPILYRFSGRSRSGFAISRRDFDSWLVTRAVAAGATLSEGTRVLGRVDQGLRVRRGRQELTLGARLVVGAGGLGCPIARELGGRRIAGRIALRAELDGVPETGSWGEAHLIGRGFVGIAPLGESRANVTAVLDRDALRERDRPDAAGLWRRATLEAGLDDRLAHARRIAPFETTGPLGFRAPRLVADRTLVLGDAAGFVDPFTGDGVSIALHSAELAAPIAIAALACGAATAAALAPWVAAHRRFVLPRLRFDRMLRALAGHPGVIQRALAALALNPDLGERVLAVPADLAPPRSLFALDFLLPLARALAEPSLERRPA